MNTFPNSPRLLKGGIVLPDSATAAGRRIILLQYNLARGDHRWRRGAALRNIAAQGPPLETIKLQAEIDATAQLEFSAHNPNAVKAGFRPQLAALEAIVYPTSGKLQSNPSRQAGNHSDTSGAESFHLKPETDPACLIPISALRSKRSIPISIRFARSFGHALVFK